MKKIFILLLLLLMMVMTSCSSDKKKSMVYDYVDTEIEYCKPDDSGHFEVSLILENGERFIYHSTHDVTQTSEEIHVNMGYNFEEKVTKLAVIKPQS